MQKENALQPKEYQGKHLWSKLCLQNWENLNQKHLNSTISHYNLNKYFVNYLKKIA